MKYIMKQRNYIYVFEGFKKIAYLLIPNMHYPSDENFHIKKMKAHYLFSRSVSQEVLKIYCVQQNQPCAVISFVVSK